MILPLVPHLYLAGRWGRTDQRQHNEGRQTRISVPKTSDECGFCPTNARLNHVLRVETADTPKLSRQIHRTHLLLLLDGVRYLRAERLYPGAVGSLRGLQPDEWKTPGYVVQHTRVV